MKHGKKPSVRQAGWIHAAGLDFTEWLVVKDLPHSMIIVNRETGEQLVIEK